MSNKVAKTVAYTPEQVRDVSEKVYRARLDPGGPERLEAEKPGSVRRNAAIYDHLSRVYMKILLDKVND